MDQRDTTGRLRPLLLSGACGLLLLPAALAAYRAPAPDAERTPKAAAEVETAAPATAPSAVAAPAAAAAPGASSAEVERLASDLSGMIRVSGWSNDAWGVMVVSLDHGDTLFAHGADRPLMPASNMKLFTSAAALRYLGPSYRYATYLATGGRIENGVLEGDLHVYGTGDPTLSDRFLENDLTIWRAFADTLALYGVTRIAGDVVGDGSYFSGPPTGTAWHDSYINAWYAAPAGALAFNENIVTLRVRPAEQTGWRPQVRMVPGGEGIALVNLATTTAGGSRTLEVTRVAYDGPIVIRGNLPRGSGELWRAVPVADPARYAAAVFAEVLRERGIQIGGVVRSIHKPSNSLFTNRTVFSPALGEQPDPSVLALHLSPPLLEILKVVNKRSHNLYAEQVLRTVGRVAENEGSVQAGERAVERLLARGAGSGWTLEMDDGSGLSTSNRTTPRTIIQLLDVMRGTPLFETYLETLPEAGERGLRRMGGTQAQGNLRAKTGTINNVSALSGYVTAANGERLAFSIMANGVPSTWRAKRVEDRIGARLASFTRPRPAPRTAPAPAPTASPDSAAQPAPPPMPRDTQPLTPSATQQQPPQAQPEPEQPAAPSTHVIRSGDTLDGIARQYGTTVNALRQANPGLNPRRLIPGREVKLP